MIEPPSLDVLSEAIVTPLTSLNPARAGGKGTFDGGVICADGSVCARSLHNKAGFLNEPSLAGDARGLARIAGKHLYGGMLKNEHFGHFLVESLSRLWALQCFLPGLDSIVYYKRLPRHPVPGWACDLISILAPGIPVFILSEATVFETLIVPDQVADTCTGFIRGDAPVRAFLAPLRQIEGKPFEKLYVSRSRLEAAQGSFLGEEILEANLAREGFTILHPQQHSIREQFSYFNGARTILLAEGSAVHLLALTCRPEQRIYIIQRRRDRDIEDLASQLRSFGSAPLFGPGEPAVYLAPERNGPSYNGARVRVDFSKLRDQLVAAGLAWGADWVLPDETSIRAEIGRLEASLGQRLVEHSANSLHGWAADPATDDLAYRKPALSSSTSPWSRYRDPARDARGANGESLANDYGFHTGGETDPWWTVDLLQEYVIDEVAIVNRRSQARRFKTFRIDSSLDRSAWTTRFTQADPIDVSGEMDWPWRAWFADPFAARYVRITLLGPGPLHLRRVQVFGANSVPAGKRAIARLLAKYPPRDFFRNGSELREGLLGLAGSEDIVEPLRRVLARERDHAGLALLYEQAAALGLPVPSLSNDLAFCKPATASSTSAWSRYPDPERDACGANGELPADDYGFHTGTEKNPWWLVDLLDKHVVEEVAIVNRRTQAQRFRSFRIETSLDEISWETRFTQAEPIDISSETASPWRLRFADPCPARYVRITLLGTGPLHLRRVQVFGPALERQSDRSAQSSPAAGDQLRKTGRLD